MDKHVGLLLHFRSVVASPRDGENSCAQVVDGAQTHNPEDGRDDWVGQDASDRLCCGCQ